MSSRSNIYACGLCRYELGDTLGSGSFGTVRTAFDRKTGRTLAVKQIPKTRPNVEPDRIAHRIEEEVRPAECWCGNAQQPLGHGLQVSSTRREQTLVLLQVGVLLQVQDCPEALQLHGVYQNESHVFIVTDYCRGGDLEQFLRVCNPSKRTPAAVQLLALQAHTGSC